MCITNYARLFNSPIATVESYYSQDKITLFIMYRTDLERVTLLSSCR